jgi:hypothetical protein
MLYAFQQVHRGYPVSNGGYNQTIRDRSRPEAVSRLGRLEDLTQGARTIEVGVDRGGRW